VPDSATKLPLTPSPWPASVQIRQSPQVPHLHHYIVIVKVTVSSARRHGDDCLRSSQYRRGRGGGIHVGRTHQTQQEDEGLDAEGKQSKDANATSAVDFAAAT